jgi:hypothetical protein
MGQLESALDAMDKLGMTPGEDRIVAYAAAAMAVAEFDVTRMEQHGDDAQSAVTAVVLGTVLYEPLLLALRRLAQGDAYPRHRGGG